MSKRRAGLGVVLALVGLLLGLVVPAGADENDPGPVGGGTVGGGGVSVSIGIGHPGGGGGGDGGGPALVGTWTETFVAFCSASGGQIVLLPFIWPFPILPVPVGDISSGIQGLVIQHTLLSPAGETLLTYQQNQCDPASPPPPVAPPTFDAVAAVIQLPDPYPATSPRVDGLVGLESWFWWEDEDGSQRMEYPIATAALDGRWVASGTARLVRLDWALGNGDGRSATGAALPGSEQDPSAAYTYQYDGTYPIVATATWHVEVTLTDVALGLTTPLVVGNTTTQSPPRDYLVREVQAVGVNG